MTRARAAERSAAALYLAVTLTVSYAMLGPYDGVEYEPRWAGTIAFEVALLALHVAAGAAIARWWALALPVAWALPSFGAEGYDTPVSAILLFHAPIFWIPAVAVGVGLAKVARRPAARPS